LASPSELLGVAVPARFPVRPTRRQLLKFGAAAGGALALDSALGPRARAAGPPRAPRRLRPPDSLPFPNHPAGEHLVPQIQHVVVVMMENHSYDNYLGWLGLEGRGDGFRAARDGRPRQANPVDPADPAKGQVRAFHAPNTCAPLSTTQSWDASHQQYGGGRNDGFVITSGPDAMSYLTDTDLPYYYGLARTFPLCDRWFASTLGPTYPNRRFLMAGTASGLTGDPLPSPTDFTTRPANGTIFDRLNAYGVSWKDYATDLGTTMLYPYLVKDNPGRVLPVATFFADAAAGTLPALCFVEPEYIDGSEEYSNDVNGEAFAAAVIDAVIKSPAWPTTVVVWCYDEHGGLYDHVPPPPAIRPDAIPPQAANTYGDLYSRYGFRVPAVVISPYARPVYVSSVVRDHTAILKLVSTVWNLPALTWRDANADNLLDCLDLTTRAFAEPALPPAPRLQSDSVACTVTQSNTSP
jgi:phospholipase C